MFKPEKTSVGDKMNIAIVEDMQSDRDALKNCISVYAERNQLNCNVRCFSDGVSFITDYKPIYDLIFMDIQMPFKDGIDIARKLREIDETVCLVFITNMRSCAIQGYEVSATDFILKPISQEIFDTKFKKISANIEKSRNSEIEITSKSVIQRVRAADIDYVEVVNHKCIYHVDKREIESWDSLAKIYESLKTFNFAYCNSCYIVNLNKVVSVEDDMAVLMNGTRLKISRAKRKEFLMALSASF